MKQQQTARLKPMYKYINVCLKLQCPYIVYGLGPVHMEVGSPGSWGGYPGLVGFPASPYILSCFSVCVHMRGGGPHSGGQPVSSGRVTRLGGVDFFHVNALPRGAEVRFIRAFVIFSPPKTSGKRKLRPVGMQKVYFLAKIASKISSTTQIWIKIARISIA